jgi:hypothetical protein
MKKDAKYFYHYAFSPFSIENNPASKKHLPTNLYLKMQ